MNLPACRRSKAASSPGPGVDVVGRIAVIGVAKWCVGCKVGGSWKSVYVMTGS